MGVSVGQAWYLWVGEMMGESVAHGACLSFGKCRLGESERG